MNKRYHTKYSRKIKRCITFMLAVCFLLTNATMDSWAIRVNAQKETTGEQYPAFSSIIKQLDLEDCYESARIDFNEKSVQMDEKKKKLSDMISVSSAKEKAFWKKPNQLKKYLEKSDFEVEYDASKKVMSVVDPYQVNQIIVKSNTLPEKITASKIAYEDGLFLLKYDSKEETKAAYEELVQRYGQDRVTLDYVVSAQSRQVTSSKQKVDVGEKTGMDELVDKIDASSIKKSAVKVAVIDSGLNYTKSSVFDHRVNQAGCYNVFTGGSNVTDSLGHGTSVSSLIVENTPEEVSVTMYKVFDTDESTTYSCIISGLNRAVKDGADVVNMSFGASDCPALYENQLRNLVRSGAVVVTAAGNDSNVSADEQYPANSSYTLAVSAVNGERSENKQNVTYFSSVGNCVDFSAYGENVKAIDMNGKTTYVDGTSFSSPVVAAQFAILKMFAPTQNQSALKQVMVDHFISDDFDADYETNRKYDDLSYGHGYMDFHNVTVCENTEDGCHGIWHEDASSNSSNAGSTSENSGDAGIGTGSQSGTSTVPSTEQKETTTEWSEDDWWENDSNLCTVSFDTMCEVANPAPVKLEWGSNLVSNLPTVTRPGYIFRGWYTSRGARIVFWYPVVRNMTVYAKWSVDASYKGTTTTQATTTEQNSASTEQGSSSETTDQNATSTEQKNTSETTDQDATSTDQGNTPETANQDATSTEQKNASGTANQDATSTEQKNASGTANQDATSTEQKNASGTANQGVTSTEQKNASGTANQGATSTGQKSATGTTKSNKTQDTDDKADKTESNLQQVVSKEGVLDEQTEETDALQVGDICSNRSDTMEYKVISKNEVKLIGYYGKSTKLVIPDTVSYENTKYKVVSIASNVTSKKLKSITIGKYIKTISKNAFTNCSKLKKIVIKSLKLKASGVKKQAFKKQNKKVKVIVKASKLSAREWKKILKFGE